MALKKITYNGSSKVIIRLCEVVNDLIDRGSGGHTIQNSSGTDMTARTNLQFTGASVSDDAVNDRTIVAVPTDISAFNNDAGYLDSSDVSAVAISGDYDDLLNKPTIPSAQVNSDWNAVSGVAEILNKPSLATVATSGLYSDLSGTPSLATVATSGSYNDLSNKPTIPTVNNGVLTIQKDGETVQTFSANQSGNATANIPSDTSELSDSEPYILRQGKGDLVDLDIEGGSVAWNQLVDSGTSSVTIPSGRKYILWQNSTLTKATSDGTAISVTGGTDKVYDITLMFGTTVADSLTVDQFKQYFPNYANYAYDSVSIQSVNVSGRKVVGKNLWNESYDNISNSVPYYKAIFVGNGTFTCSSTTPYQPGTTNTNIFFLSGNVSSGASSWTNGVSVGNPKTVQSVNGYVTIAYRYQNNTDPREYNTQIELGSTATSYEPYTSTTYPLDSTKQLRGIPQLVNNKLNYDGDIYKADGSITRKYGIVDLGTLTWTDYQTNCKISNDLQSLAKKPSSGSVVANIITTNYINNIPSAVVTDQATKKQVCINISGTIIVSDGGSATSPAGYLVYELATTTTETALSYQNPQRAYPDGTEEFIDYAVSQSTRDVAIPCGHNSDYTSNNVLSPIEDYVDGSVALTSIDALRNLMYLSGLRFKNLGTSFTADQATAIANGDFSDFWNGDYWEDTSQGIIWRIVDNTGIARRRGNPRFDSPSLVIMPDYPLIASDSIRIMYNSATTANGYKGTNYRNTYRSQCRTKVNNFFGATHCADHKELISTASTSGKASGWEWNDCDVELPTEVNMYGHNVWSCYTNGGSGFNIGAEWGQFRLFSLAPYLVLQPNSTDRNQMLRDIVDSSNFAYISRWGHADKTSADGLGFGARPYFLLV